MKASAVGKFRVMSILAVPENCKVVVKGAKPETEPLMLLGAVVSPPVAKILPVCTIGAE